MRRPSPVLVAAGGVTTIVVAALVTGGVLVARIADPPSPTTTVTADDGSEVVLDWADYPAEAWVEPEDVLAAPRAEDVEETTAAQLAALEAAIDQAAPGMTWATDPADEERQQLFPVGGNGYGGQSLHAVWNGRTQLGSGLAEDADWHAMAAALDAQVADLGYDPITWSHERAPYPGESVAERDAEILAAHGSLDPDEMWSWSGSARDGSMWLDVQVWDARRATAPADPWQSTTAGIAIMLGGTVVSADDEQAYVDGIAPFEGLSRPEPTHSD